ncbi:MAG TPA: curli production assembly/transport protein CsgE [Candidimonas sp.]|nr:curli production assembly/transport protein CsgE [Candidimonas sp.]
MGVTIPVAAFLALALSSVTAHSQNLSVTRDTPTRVVTTKNEPADSVAGSAPDNDPTPPADRRKSVFDDPLAGVVVNRTVTVLGKDFYQYFTAIWRQKDVNSQFSISIHERPSARFGSEIWVQFGQKRMFHTFLPPARSATKKISAMAVNMVYDNIKNSEVERLMVKSPDLGPEEM